MSADNLHEAVVLFITGEIQLDTPTVFHILELASDAYYNVEATELAKYPLIDLETGEVVGEGSYELTEFLDDDTYNTLERMAKAIDPKNPFFLTVGSDVRGGKVPLPFVMGSLDQAYEDETEKWVAQYKLGNDDFILSDKLDGTSVALIYDRQGNLHSGFSRGNGTMGADITRHLKRIKSVPQKIAKGPLKVRAEAIIPVKDWPTIKAQAESRSGRTYKNARNYVAGKMNASDTDTIFADNVHIVITSVEEPVMGKLAQLEFVRSQGFLTNYYVATQGNALNDTFLTPYLNERRANASYELDGIVIDVDDIGKRNALPKTTSSLNPTYAKKYKVAAADNMAVTKVAAIHWRLSKDGYLKPRVEIEPVDLSGVTITFATGFNAKFIVDNNLGPSATIRITRSGDVIPYITEVITGTSAALPDATKYGSMSWTKGNVDLFLDDPDSHPDVRYYRILDAFKRLDVPHLRQSAVEKLIAAGFDTEAKIIKATEAELIAVVGDGAGKKIAAGMKAKLNPVDLALLAGSSQTLGRGIGTRKVKKILAALGTLDVTVAQLCEVDGFEKKTAEIVVRNVPRFNAFLAEIAGYYTIAQAVAPPADGELKGMTILFTGVRDKDLEAAIVAKAGTIGTSMNKDTTYLVAKDTTGNSSKLVKARQLLDDDHIITLAQAQDLWK